LNSQSLSRTLVSPENRFCTREIVVGGAILSVRCHVYECLPRRKPAGPFFLEVLPDQAGAFVGALFHGASIQDGHISTSVGNLSGFLQNSGREISTGLQFDLV
jgi:hypothetical protein